MALYSCVAAYATMSWRPIYSLFFIFVAGYLAINRRSAQATNLLLAGALIFLFLVLTQELSILTERLVSRASIPHVGREFFNGQCVEERASVLLLPKCWLGFISGLSFHPDMASINALILLSFQLVYFSTLMLLFKCFRKNSWTAVLVFIATHILIFWWGPTAGAYLRYAIPISWFVSFLWIVKLRESNFCKVNKTNYLRLKG